MKRVREMNSDNLEQVLSAELATAGNPSDIDARIALISLYCETGMTPAFQAELNRLRPQFPNHPLVLAGTIRMLIEQRSLRQLHAVAEQALKVVRLSPACPWDLKLAVAEAYAALNRPDTASLQYAQLIEEDGFTDDVVSRLAEFACKYPMGFKLLKAIENLADGPSKAKNHPLFLYVLCKTQLCLGDLNNADGCLTSMDANNIYQPAIALDLGVIAFRLANLKKAAEMAERSFAISADNSLAAEFLVSVRSFAGELQQASEQFETLSSSYPQLSLNSRQVEAIVKYSLEQVEPEPSSGVISFSHWSSNKSAICSDRFCRGPAIAEGQVPVVTASAPGAKKAGARPWDVLTSIDRRFPHIMVQRLKDHQIIHAFVAVNKVESWPWQEVPLVVGDSEAILNRNAFRWMLPKQVHSSNSGGTTANDLLAEVEREIESANLLEGL